MIRNYLTIVGLTLALWIVYWTTDVFPDAIIPTAGMFSLIIMDFLNLFGPKKEPVVDEEELSERQKEFRRKLEEGKEIMDTDVIIAVTSNDGKFSQVTIKTNGDVETEGDVPDDIRQAALLLRADIIELGVDAVADQLMELVAKMNEERDDA